MGLSFIFCAGLAQPISKLRTPTKVNYIRHSVQLNETFASIGKLYNVSPERLSAFNYIENYTGRVIARYLHVPLTTRNFSSHITRRGDEILVPVFSAGRQREKLITVRSGENARMRGRTIYWSNSDLKRGSNTRLRLLGYLHTAKVNAPYFTPLKLDIPSSLERGNEARTVDKQAWSVDTVLATVSPTPKDSLQKTDTVASQNVLASSAAPSVPPKVIGHNQPVERTRLIDYLFVWPTALMAANVIFTFFIFSYLAKKNTNRRSENTAVHYIGNLLSKAVNEKPASVNIHSDIKNLKLWLAAQKQSSPVRQTLVDEIVTAKKNFNGAAASNLGFIYQQLKLDEYSNEKLQSKLWQTRISGLNELAIMGHIQWVPEIANLLNDRSQFVRVEAQNALFNILGFDALPYLRNSMYEISDWQQIRLMEQLAAPSPLQVSYLPDLLKSTNHSVIVFSLKLIALTQCFPLHDNVISLLYHTENTVRIQALKTLLPIANVKTPYLLQSYYSGADKASQVGILKLLGYIGCETQEEFFLRELSNTDPFIQLAAAEALARCNRRGLKILGDYCYNKSKPYLDLYFHVKQRLNA